LSSEKEAKRLYSWALRQDPGHGLEHGSGGGTKVFWFFSSEKNILPCLCANLQTAFGRLHMRKRAEIDLD
jgi:hypothetical protein